MRQPTKTKQPVTVLDARGLTCVGYAKKQSVGKSKRAKVASYIVKLLNTLSQLENANCKPIVETIEILGRNLSISSIQWDKESSKVFGSFVLQSE